MKYLVIFVIFFIAISINEVHAVMSYSEFQEFCKETENMNLDLMPIDQRLLAHLCDYLDLGLSEKHWNWIGADVDWKNFAQNVSDEYAQQIPLFVEKGLEDSLVVDTSISGRDSFPPPMFAYISFYYDEDNKTKRFGEKYIVNIFGEFSKAKDHRLPPLKLFNTGYYLDEIQCKQNLVLIQKYDGSPACVAFKTKEKLIHRGWAIGETSNFQEILEQLRQGPREVSFEHAEMIKSLVILDPVVSEFLKDTTWDYSCCGYLSVGENNPNYKLVINFFDHDDKKQLAVVFDLETLQIEKRDFGNMVKFQPFVGEGNTKP